VEDAGLPQDFEPGPWREREGNTLDEGGLLIEDTESTEKVK